MSHREEEHPRRSILKAGLAAGGIAATVGLPLWSRLVAARDDDLVPFTDVPASFKAPPVIPGAVHFLDTRQIKTFYTSNDDFYVVQHYNQPKIAQDEYTLRVTGLVDKPMEIGLADLKRRPAVEIDAGFECGGNSAGLFQGLIGNARWRGVSLSELLRDAGIRPEGIEVVFYGTDQGTENIRKKDVQQNFGRSLQVGDAQRPELMLAYEMNGQPLSLYHGAPLRLLVPGWYGVANVKWLAQIHVQDRRFMGRFMARDYVTLSRRDIGGVERWEERSVTKMRLKSSIIRVARADGGYEVTGFVLNDGTPLRSVEVKIDSGPWEAARVDPQSSRYSWKLFSYLWKDASPGKHTLVSRVTDANGEVQPTADQMPEKPTRWENNAQFPRTVMIS